QDDVPAAAQPGVRDAPDQAQGLQASEPVADGARGAAAPPGQGGGPGGPGGPAVGDEEEFLEQVPDAVLEVDPAEQLPLEGPAAVPGEGFFVDGDGGTTRGDLTRGCL